MRHLIVAVTAALALSACGKKEEPPAPPPFAPFVLEVGQNKEDLVRLETSGEAVLTLEGTASGAQWGKKSAEALVVRVTVNNRLSRDVVWATGSTVFQARVALGQLEAGEHNIKVEVVPELSRNETGAKLDIAKISLTPHEDQALARYAPILLGKDTSTSTDLPVLVYGSKTEKGYRYSVVFTNVDGATVLLPPRVVMAQSARLAGIEWAYEVDLDEKGNVTTSRFQALNREVKAFSGTREGGEHPLLRVDGEGGMFSDDGSKGLFTFAPAVIAFDEASQPRERVLDLNPWVYELVDAEGGREEKIDTTCASDTKVWASDCYLYVDGDVKVEATNPGELRRLYGIQVLPTDGELTLSEAGMGILGRMNRSGQVRIAVPLKRDAQVQAVRLYSAPDALGGFQVFLKAPSATRIVAGKPTQLFAKTATIKVTELQTQTTFGP